jgi:AraC-like DNA-binding protein
LENNPEVNIKRGYLKENFAYFHLKDQKTQEYEFHYHEFNKIVIFISGKVTYLIEGKSYNLKPWDILLVSESDIHKVIIDAEKVYERIIIWVNNSFLERHNEEKCDLFTCFKIASSQKFNLLRLEPELIKGLRNILLQLEEANHSDKFGSHILKNSLFLQLMVYFNRAALGRDITKSIEDITYDKTVEAVIDYINENLGGELSIDVIADKLYLNKYYLMHKFKTETGYTIHNYIVQKRLLRASSLIKEGIPTYEVFLESGFGDYSSFVRAFKKQFGLSPKKYYKAVIENTRD